MGKRLFRTIKKKIRSEQGATLSMAMLLFLVCAIVGGVILAAATAAGGRLSLKADMDKRYYSVSSAVQFLAENLEGEEITIDQIMVDTYETDGLTPPPATPSADAEYDFRVNGNAYYGVADFLSDRAVYFMFGTKVPEKNRIWDASFEDPDKSDETTGEEFRMALYEEDGTTLLGEQVTCTGKVLANGTLLIDVENKEGEDENGMRITMLPNIAETQIEEADEIPIAAEPGSGTLFQVTRRVVKSSTISWYISSIEQI